AKFPAEEETYNVRAAVLRHDVRHPVVNDRNFLLWRAYAVRAWPTLTVIGPDGYVVGAHSGEFDAEVLGEFLEELIGRYDAQGLIDRTPLELSPEKERQLETLLSFPGKVLYVPPAQVPPDWRGPAREGLLFVADTDHHRILQFGVEDGRLGSVYGAGEPGLLDGSSRRARFNAPQGLTLRGDALYVADTENHAVRKIALPGGVVTTVAGTGRQAQPWPEEGPAREAALNSPWDVLAIGEELFIAMAGSHQIWRLHLPSGRLSLFAGDGREALQDGPRLLARLAQPSGLATDGEQLWFVDSETSSLRSVPLSGLDERVVTHVGQGLFDFGDVDGQRDRARMQHALGVACAGGRVYVADAYNNKIRMFDPQSGELQTLAGSGEPGLQDGAAGEACFWEPGGLSAGGDRLWVADTNNHAVRGVDRITGEVRTVELLDPTDD
ncbi:MAG TPA: alkyl hydroperoxide reductase, partial [Armatimonadota bacterium]|nr:alkyl hydroperoxide reductase [Armatimonadota bacterium]